MMPNLRDVKLTPNLNQSRIIKPDEVLGIPVYMYSTFTESPLPDPVEKIISRRNLRRAT